MQELKHPSANIRALFDEIGGDPLARSGFETEEPESDFNKSSQIERPTTPGERSER